MYRLVALLICLALPSNAGSEPLRVFAAASLKGPLDQAVATFQKETEQEVRVSYAASSLLARQIVQGARADVFWSANAVWVDYLQNEIQLRDIEVPLGNAIVLAGTNGAPDGADALCQTGRLVTARTDAVPLGQYTKAGLASAGNWPLPKGCLIETDNARAALIAVLRGEAVAGYLYASDAEQAGLDVLRTLPVPEPVIYPLAALSEEGEHLVAFLSSSAGLAPFLEAGFLSNAR